MFGVLEQLPFDFESEANAPKWKGLFINALLQVQHQVHASLTAKNDALEYIESLILRLLGMLCATQPHAVSDVEERVQRTFPHPIDRWAIADAQAALEKGKKKSPLVLPVDKVHHLLQKEVLCYKIDYQVSLYIVAVLEYISADILKLAGNYVRNIRHNEITCQDIRVAMCADKVLMDMFYQDEDVAVAIEEEPITKTSGTYDEVIKDFIYEEKQYLRDLRMIIKVFREPCVGLLPVPKDLDIVFSNILDIHEFTVTLLGSIEDAIEMTEENHTPAVGWCFEELAEAAEFDVYEKYAHDILGSFSRDKLYQLLQRSDVCDPLQTAGHGFKSAVKYVLPKLQLGPIHHCFQYFDYIKMFRKLSSSQSDKESLEQAEGLLKPLQVDIERICGGVPARKKFGETSLRLFSRMSRPAALQKMNELQKSIDGWEGKDIGQCCNEFILDGTLGKIGSGKRLTERHVFLFDGLMILCKQNNRRSSVTGPVGEFRLKEKFFIRKIEIRDREDTEELKNAFEIAPRDQPHVVFFTKTHEEKCNWMAALIMLSTRSMLERILDSILAEEEKKHPLKLPSPALYRFAEEDSDKNIMFEEKEITLGVPVIKGATLLKLVERLTYHMYADPMLVRTFLTTFRSFSQPMEVLDLLIERFDIPDPPLPQAPPEDMNPIEREILKNAKREECTRFRKEYCQPVKFRVFNVLRHWVDHHFYDFERDPELLHNLNHFLENVRSKAMRKWVDSITKIILRRREKPDEPREVNCYFTTPRIEWYIARSYEQFDLMSLHPIELARQLTLLEFDLYRAVKPSELVGTVWTKKDKEKTSPNLLKMIHHSTNFTLWLEKWVVEAENLDERISVISRIIEIMLVLQDLNNFNGVLEVVSAMNSASVYRLEHSFNGVNHKLIKSLEDSKELHSDHYKKYHEKLRSINPPCVPFFGMYLTNILHIEEGNPDFLPNHEGAIINFSKRRKVAEIVGEIQQYQNQPYCLSTEQSIRTFLEALNPMGDLSEKEFNDYLYAKSLEIEPRNCKQPPKFARRFADTYLKSPGIKPRGAGRGPHPGPLPSIESTLLRSNTRLTEDREPHSPRVQNTPPTPSTPLTPPHSANATANDSSVFAHVLIPSGNLSPGPFTSINPLLPPPLPPRSRKREQSIGDTSPKVKQAPDAPLLPPRDSSPAPPLPPRSTFIGGTLPRMTPTSSTQRENLGSLPRRNSALEMACSSTPPPPPTIVPRRSSQSSMNGPLLSPTPVLPPKTYKQTQLNHTSTSPR